MYNNSYSNIIFYGYPALMPTVNISTAGGGAGGSQIDGGYTSGIIAGPGKVWYVNNQIYGQGGYAGNGGAGDTNPQNAIVNGVSGYGARSVDNGGNGIPINSGNAGGGARATSIGGKSFNSGGSGASGVFIIACY